MCVSVSLSISFSLFHSTYKFTFGVKKAPLQPCPFSFRSALDSIPTTSPTIPHSDRLKVAPRASACGNEVGDPVDVYPVSLFVYFLVPAQHTPCSASWKVGGTTPLFYFKNKNG